MPARAPFTGKRPRRRCAALDKLTNGKKAILFSLLALFSAAAAVAVILLSAPKNETVLSEAPFADVLAAVTDAADLSETQPGENAILRRLYGLDPALFEEYALYYPDSNMGAREMLLAKLKDPADRETLVAAAGKRVEAQIGVFEGYAPEQTALLKTHTVIEAPGNYFLFLVDEHSAAAAAAFSEVIRNAAV